MISPKLNQTSPSWHLLFKICMRQFLWSFFYTLTNTCLQVICVSGPSTVMSKASCPIAERLCIKSWGLEDQGFKWNSRDCLSGITKSFQNWSPSAGRNCYMPLTLILYALNDHYLQTRQVFLFTVIVWSTLFKKESRHVRKT